MKEESFNNPFADLKSLIKEATPKTEILPGKYVIRVKFVNRKGQEVIQEVKQINVTEPKTLGQIESKALSETSALGLHNFGMDVYVGNYPDGHPVELSVKNESSEVVHKFTEVFGGSGYPIKK